jgi:hypothetical protein
LLSSCFPLSLLLAAKIPSVNVGHKDRRIKSTPPTKTTKTVQNLQQATGYFQPAALHHHSHRHCSLGSTSLPQCDTFINLSPLYTSRDGWLAISCSYYNTLRHPRFVPSVCLGSLQARSLCESFVFRAVREAVIRNHRHPPSSAITG